MTYRVALPVPAETIRHLNMVTVVGATNPLQSHHRSSCLSRPWCMERPELKDELLPRRLGGASKNAKVRNEVSWFGDRPAERNPLMFNEVKAASDVRQRNVARARASLPLLSRSHEIARLRAVDDQVQFDAFFR